MEFGFGFMRLFYLVLAPLFFVIPIIIAYFVIKLAVKNAIKELKNEKII